MLFILLLILNFNYFLCFVQSQNKNNYQLSDEERIKNDEYLISNLSEALYKEHKELSEIRKKNINLAQSIKIDGLNKPFIVSSGEVADQKKNAILQYEASIEELIKHSNNLKNESFFKKYPKLELFLSLTSIVGFYTLKMGTVVLSSYLSSKMLDFLKKIDFRRQFKPFIGNGSITFENIAGGKRIKEELSDVIEYFKDPKKYLKEGIRPVKGYLFYGSPGTGKTYIAKALANELSKKSKKKIPIFIINSTHITGSLVGESEKLIKTLFEVARSYQPCIIFFDEIDSIAPSRKKSIHGYEKSAVNTLLSEIDGFGDKDMILIIGTTNLINDIDPALLRSGRLEKHINFSLPLKKERYEIISMYLKRTNKKLENKLSVETLAEKFNGLSPSEIEDVINRAIARAFKYNDEIIKESVINEVIMEKEFGFKHEFDHNKNDLLNTAYHEAGHALMQMIQKDYMYKFDNLTIDSRSGFLGVSVARKKSDYLNPAKENFIADIKVSLAGRIAEEVIFNNIQTAGASSDLNSATKIVKKMIQSYAMGNRLLVTRNKEGKMSTKEEVEAENILQKCYLETKEFLIKHKILLDMIVEKLIVEKTLYENDIKKIIDIYEKKIGYKIDF
jgi:cell division protease FtsH